MRLVLISDTHSLHDEVTLPEGDVLIHAGDFCGWGTPGELAHFCNWLRYQDFKHKLVIAGNHDRILQSDRTQAEWFLRQAGATYLEDSGVTIDGVSYYGSPWTPEFYNWAFMKKRGPEIDERWQLIPDDLDVLITHGPPAGILDLSTHERMGCEMLAQRVREKKPAIHVFGHNHTGYGFEADAGTAYYNVSQVNDMYDVVYKPVVIDVCVMTET